MCFGTRCTHHFNPAVEWLEEDYDKWDVQSVPCESADGSSSWASIHVVNRQVMRGGDAGPGHNQAMIRLKEDWNPRWDEMSPEEIESCFGCVICRGVGHACSRCSKPITHMQSGSCPECWYWWEMHVHGDPDSPLQAAVAARTVSSGPAMVSMVRGPRPSQVIYDEVNP